MSKEKKFNVIDELAVTGPDAFDEADEADETAFGATPRKPRDELIAYSYRADRNPDEAGFPGVPLRSLTAAEFREQPEYIQRSIAAASWYVATRNTPPVPEPPPPPPPVLLPPPVDTTEPATE